SRPGKNKSPAAERRRAHTSETRISAIAHLSAERTLKEKALPLSRRAIKDARNTHSYAVALPACGGGREGGSQKRTRASGESPLSGSPPQAGERAQAPYRVREAVYFFFSRAFFGMRIGQRTMWSSSWSSEISFSVPLRRPRTETPAMCTVSGSPDTSGCHQ